MAELKARIGLDTSAFETGLARLQNSAGTIAKGIGGVLAGAFALDKLIQGFSSAIEKADQLQDIAEKFGLSASKLQMLGNAAAVYGSGLENVSAGLNKLALAQQKAVAGDGGLQDTFREVGITLEELKSMGPEDVFLRIADSFASGVNDGRQFIIVNELLGKAQTDLIKVMNQGSAAIIEQGNSMGVWSNETISKLSAASDAIKTFGNIITIVFGEAASKIMSAVESYARWAAIRPLIRFFDDSKAGSSGSIRQASLASENSQASKDFQKELERMDVAEARQELRMIEAGIAGRDAAQKVLDNFKAESGGKSAALETPGVQSSMQVLADSLQQVGGGGRFAQIGGVETIQRDQLTVLKKIEKNTAKAGATFDGQVFNIGAQ